MDSYKAKAAVLALIFGVSAGFVAAEYSPSTVTTPRFDAGLFVAVGVFCLLGAIRSRPELPIASRRRLAALGVGQLLLAGTFLVWNPTLSLLGKAVVVVGLVWVAFRRPRNLFADSPSSLAERS